MAISIVKDGTTRVMSESSMIPRRSDQAELMAFVMALEHAVCGATIYIDNITVQNTAKNVNNRGRMHFLRTNNPHMVPTYDRMQKLLNEKFPQVILVTGGGNRYHRLAHRAANNARKEIERQLPERQETKKAVKKLVAEAEWPTDEWPRGLSKIPVEFQDGMKAQVLEKFGKPTNTKAQK